MKNPKTPITGVVETSIDNFVFYLDDYTAVFMKNELRPYAECSELKSVDGFIPATTHQGEKMLLHCRNDALPIFNSSRISFSSYIVSTSKSFNYDMKRYDGIVFVGGTVAKLKFPHGMNVSFDENGKQCIEYNDDKQMVSFSTDDFTCEITIGSSTKESYGYEGNSIVNEDVYFKMIFDVEQKISSIYLHYGKICELLSFLTNRKNVGFEEIYLLKNIPNIGLQRVAQVYIRQVKPLTEKNQYYNLEFGLLGDTLSALLNILYTPKERKKSYSLNFYPENDEKATIITNDIVRNVCSGIECELKFVDSITSDEKRKIKKLSDELKVIIDAHKNSTDRLRDKTYSLIESSMSHWSMSASDQFKALYHIYDDEMAILNKTDTHFGDEEIDDFVKYRNEITHGSYRVLNPTIAYMTYLLAGLIYCCVLTRIGVPRESIRQWCQEGRILS